MRFCKIIGRDCSVRCSRIPNCRAAAIARYSNPAVDIVTAFYFLENHAIGVWFRIITFPEIDLLSVTSFEKSASLDMVRMYFSSSASLLVEGAYMRSRDLWYHVASVNNSPRLLVTSRYLVTLPRKM